jgi:hypothetical protein
MGTLFEELIRRFNEENNEEAGEHWTPRDAVKLMAKLIFLPIADQIESGTYLLYDGACGTGGMLTVAEETLQQLAAEHGIDVATHLYGQSCEWAGRNVQVQPHADLIELWAGNQRLIVHPRATRPGQRFRAPGQGPASASTTGRP